MTNTPRASRLIALVVAASLALPTLAVTAGCGPKASEEPTTQTSGTTPMNSTPMNSTPMNGAPMNGTPMNSAKPGLSGKQKVVLLAGAALLFYLYQRDKKQNAAAAAAKNSSAAPAGQQQLYREEKGPNKGAVYYRKNDANHTVVWLAAPKQGVEVPADQVNQYLPDYHSNPAAYQGEVNTNPQPGVNGGLVQSADQYANQTSGGSMPSGPMPGGPRGPGM
jgi:hypothetical protein